jgi:Kef-type K+ transport system membrane component KefB
MHDRLLTDIALCVLGALVMALVARILRQPPLLGYLAAGVLLGAPMGFSLVSDPIVVESISRLGLILLLFLIGAEIDLRKLLKSGALVLGGGILQTPLNALLLLPATLPAIGLALPGLGPGRLDAFYLALVLSLSSTAIIVKLLYERRELDTLPGRVTIGIVVVQDLWAIVMLVLQPNLASPSVGQIAKSFVLGFGLLGVVLLLGRYALPRLFALVARSGEMTLLLALAWCASACAGAGACGLSLEMGALIAGITISTFPVSLEVVTRILSIRDFFVTLFFVTLGLRIPRPDADTLLLATILVPAVLASRVLVVAPLLYAFGRDLRTALVTSFNLAPVSEFALVILALGQRFGHVGPETVGSGTLVMALTAAVSPYLIANGHALYVRSRPLLARIGIVDRAAGAAGEPDGHAQRFLVLGCYHVGRGLLAEWLRKAPERKGELRFVDFNPQTYERLAELEVAVTFGDVANLDLLAHLHPERCEVVVCTLPDAVLKGTSSERLLAALRRLAPKAKIVMTAEREHVARELYRGGADYVLMPHLAGGQELADLLLFEPPLPPGTARGQQERVLRLE